MLFFYGVIQGITIKPLVKYCKIIKDTDAEKELLVELHNLVIQLFNDTSAFFVSSSNSLHFAQFINYCNTESLDVWAGHLCNFFICLEDPVK